MRKKLNKIILKFAINIIYIYIDLTIIKTKQKHN